MVYLVKVGWYNSSENAIDKRGMFLVADSLSDAMNTLIDYFGETEMEDVYLKAFSPDQGLLFNLDDPRQRELFSMVDDIIGKEVIWQKKVERTWEISTFK